MGTDVERVGLSSRGELARFFFLEVVENRGIIGKTNGGKHAILSHFPMVKTPNSNFQSKHTPYSIILHLLSPNPTGIFCSRVLHVSCLLTDVLRGQSWPLQNVLQWFLRCVLQFVLQYVLQCVLQCYPNQIYKQKFINNADAKLQALQYAKL